MEWKLDLTIGVIESFDLAVTIFLACLLAKIGWRFTNIRAAKDLVLEEGRLSLQVCDKIRKELRDIPTFEIPEYELFSEHLDDLGNYLSNCKKMYHGISKKSQSDGIEDNWDQAFLQLRVALSGDTSREGTDALSALTHLRKFEDKIVDLMVDVNN